MSLIRKYKIFANAVLAGRTKRDAAIEAGYSADTAGPAASRLLKKPAIAAYLAARVAEPVPGDESGQPQKSAAKVPDRDIRPTPKEKPAPKPKEKPRGDPKPTERKASASPPEKDEFDPMDGKHYADPKEFLKDAMNSPDLDMRQRMDAAKALMPFDHQKLGEGGKKDVKKDAAKAAANKFTQTAPPKLVVNNKQ